MTEPLSVVFELGPDCDERSVFALKVDQRITPAISAKIQEAWTMGWSKIGRGTPKLLIFERGMELASLTDNQLRQAGLMRIQ